MFPSLASRLPVKAGLLFILLRHRTGLVPTVTTVERMELNLEQLKRSLTEEQLAFFEADAAALHMTEHEYALMLIKDELRAVALELGLDDVCMGLVH